MKLISLYAELFFAPQSDRGLPIRFMLNFNDCRSFRLSMDGTGAKLLVDITPLDDACTHEYGRTAHQDVISLLSPYLDGMVIDSIEALTLHDHQVGLSLVAADGTIFHMWVDGDEFFWGNDQTLEQHWRHSDEVPRRGGEIELSPV